MVFQASPIQLDGIVFQFKAALLWSMHCKRWDYLRRSGTYEVAVETFNELLKKSQNKQTRMHR